MNLLFKNKKMLTILEYKEMKQKTMKLYYVAYDYGPSGIEMMRGPFGTWLEASIRRDETVMQNGNEDEKVIIVSDIIAVEVEYWGNRMKLFLDTEFNGFQGELLSMALVPEYRNGQEFYV